MHFGIGGKQAAMFLSASAAFGFLLFGIGGYGKLELLPFFVSAALLVIAAVSMVRKVADTRRRRVAFTSGMMRSMECILHYRACGLPTLAAMQKASEGSESEEIGRMMALLSRRIQLGEKASAAIASAQAAGEDAMGGEWGNLETPAIKTSLEHHAMMEDDSMSTIGAAGQRRATVSMFVSTVLPSFIVFAFIGSAIISDSAPSILPLEMALLVALPVVYVVSMSRQGVA